MWQGASGVVPRDGLVSPAYVTACPRPGMHSEYFELLFKTNECLNEFNRQSRGIVSDRNRLYWDQFKSISVCVPPFQVQMQIAQSITDQTRYFDAISDRAVAEIKLCRDYRARLTADVITGKLDVRAAASYLPDLDWASAGNGDSDADLDTGGDFEGEVDELDPEEAI